MPLLPFVHQSMELPLSDRQFNDTLIRQRARFVRLLHEQDASGECRAVITVEVTMYAAAGEGFGPELTSQGLPVRRIDLVADNQTLVDAADGRILAIRRGENNADWQAKSDSFAQATRLQGDFFEALRETQPVHIGEMIRQYIQQADAAGKFA